MKKGIFEIKENVKIAKDTYKMELCGDTSAVTRPGQFVNIALEGLYLRRPISVCDKSGDVLTIIYKTVGTGTKKMSCMNAGEKLDILTGLGNGYDLSPSGETPLLIGGGAGVPPMYGLGKKLVAEGKKPTAILGFNAADEVFFKEEFEALGINTIITTADGSVGRRGFVTDAMADTDYSYFYACGPEPMLRAVHFASASHGQMSFEERMGCGFGACMGCTCKTKYGNFRICKDGPVMLKEEVVW